ncbi:MAG: hypothetical protein KGZ97_04870 [Bacteroidetes bacterium]|nr:hypothetical protein [Bacteroidota bacterium]
MDDLPLIVEGFETKIKRLVFQIDQLKTENGSLKVEVSELKSEIDEKTDIITALRYEIQTLKVAKVLERGDSFQAKQKINDLLREIEKCYSLLNR